MIFVTVGTHEQPFNRLIQKIDAENINEETIDYAKVDELLKAHREVAKEYLRSNLEG